MMRSDPRALQLNEQGQLKHFLTLDGLDKTILTEILDRADSFLSMGEQSVKKVPPAKRENSR